MRKIAFYGFLFMFAFFASGCQDSKSKDKRPAVAASFYPYYEFSKQVVGNKMRVFTIVPSGVEPHDYDPAPRILAEIQSSDVFIYNGLNFDPWARGLGDQLAEKKVQVVIAEKAVKRPIKSREGPDPHFWLDLIAAQRIVDLIEEAASAKDPDNKAVYKKNARKFTERLKSLDEDFSRDLKDCQRDAVIVSHDSMGYLAKRYGFKAIPVAGLSPSREPSARKMSQIIEIARENKVRYVFFENSVNPRIARTLADEINAKTLVFNSIETLSDEQKEKNQDYFDLMRTNLSNLRTALGCN